jgi:hypothetical protein
MSHRHVEHTLVNDLRKHSSNGEPLYAQWASVLVPHAP